MGRRGSKLGSFMMIFIVLGVLYMLPHAFIGSAVLSPDQITNLGGAWDANMKIVSCEDCQDNVGFSPFVMRIDQTNDKLVGVSIEPIFQTDNEVLDSLQTNGSFISPTEIIGDFRINAQGISQAPNYITGPVDLIIASDCNSITLNADFTAYKGTRIDSQGKVQIILTRQNKNGCGFKCVENLTCSDFSGCVNGTQARTCFDVNQCNKAAPSKTESQSCALPAPVPERGSNLWIYVIIILLLLIGGVTAFIVLKKNKKPSPALKLSSIIENIDRAVLFGDKTGALEDYKRYNEMFTKYYDAMGEPERSRMYQEGLRVYQKITSQ